LARADGHLQPGLPVAADAREVPMTHRLQRAALHPTRAALWLLALFALSLGCAAGEFRPSDPFDRQFTLTESQHRYTVYVRWSDFQRAKSFVAKDDRDAYLERMKVLEDARFTDYDSEAVELDDKKEKATLRVTYTLYTPSLPYEVEVTELQEWSRDGLTNNWQVRSTFEGLPRLAAN